jgi:S-adenosylmethionine synthetase
MIEKVNPMHPDKVADRIAGAIVDLAYSKNENPKIAVEVLIGHGECNIITESSCEITLEETFEIVKRITGRGDILTRLNAVKQDEHLAENQSEEVRCGDNGIFKGVPLTQNEKTISSYSRRIYDTYPTDGKYILTDDKFIVCQSNAKNDDLKDFLREIDKEVIINPLGEWTGGTDVDTGATNRKLGSDMAQSVTGGGLHGKDLSKADVSVNIYAFKKAQKTGEVVSLCCAIGDDTIDGKPYSEIVEEARKYINSLGGFEKFAEWGLY